MFTIEKLQSLTKVKLKQLNNTSYNNNNNAERKIQRNSNFDDEYDWISKELDKVIFNKNQFKKEIIKEKIKLSKSTIYDIDIELKNRKKTSVVLINMKQKLLQKIKKIESLVSELQNNSFRKTEINSINLPSETKLKITKQTIL